MIPVLTIPLPLLSILGIAAIVGLICLTVWLWGGRPEP